MLESLFNKVVGVLSHFEEHLLTIASVASAVPRIIIIHLKELKFYFATICVESCSLDSIIDVFFPENLLLMSK